MKVDYGIIRIEVKADEEELNTNELALSDALGEIANKLENWLRRENAGACFEFEVKIV